MASDSVQKIKDRLSIIEVISPYVELHKAGKNFKGKSPFTNEKTPSFYVSPDRGMYYCFSSSQGGDMFTFIEKMEGVDFKGALKILAEKAGVELVPEDPKKRTERDQIYSALEAATKFFESELQGNEEAISYLKKRGLKPETILKWRIGYVPGPPKGGWRHTREHLLSQNFTDDIMFKAGLTKSAEAGKAPYDVFRDRIMFPIMDASGRVVGFSGRILSKDSEAPKYVNSPETELFNKSEILFGYDKARDGIRKLGFSLIVEGQFDVVLSHQAGYGNAVAVSGTALTPGHVSLLQRLSNRVVLSLDADRAGISAVKRAADLMLTRGIDLKVASLPEGLDPADMVLKSAAEFKKVIGQARHVVEFLLEVLKKTGKDERTYKLLVRDEVLPYILKINSQIDREHFAGVVGEALNTNKEAVNLELARLEAAQAEKLERESRVTVVETKSKDLNPQKRKENLLSYVVTATELISEGESQKLVKVLKEVTGLSIKELRAGLLPEVESELSFTLEQHFSELTEHERHVLLSEHLSELLKLVSKETISKLNEELKMAEADKDEKTAEKLLQKISTTQKSMVTTFAPEMF